MFNIFQQPWTLVVVALLTMNVLWVISALKPEKIRYWVWLAPLLIVVLAFGIDLLVKTDREKVHILIESAIKAAEQEDIEAFDSMFAADYSDSAHASKEAMMRFCRRMLGEPLIEKIKKMGLTEPQIDGAKASATLTVMTRFDPQSYYYRSNFPAVMVKVKLVMTKQPDKSWQLQQAELVEINKQPMTWRSVN
jgi:hypothetical protein